MGKAIFFDLDNTLVHRINSIELYAAAFYQDYQAQLNPVSIEHIATLIKQQDNGGYLMPDSPYRDIKEAVSTTLHQQLPWLKTPLLKAIVSHWHQRFPLYSVAMPGANTLLQTLSEQAYYLGIISNGRHDTRLARAKTLTNYHYINKVVSSESAGITKPNAAIFTSTLANAGLLPAQCWYVGDHPINDIQGARDAGLRTIWVKGFHPWPNDLKAADYTVEHLSEIQHIVSSTMH